MTSQPDDQRGFVARHALNKTNHAGAATFFSKVRPEQQRRPIPPRPAEVQATRGTRPVVMKLAPVLESILPHPSFFIHRINAVSRNWRTKPLPNAHAPTRSDVAQRVQGCGVQSAAGRSEQFGAAVPRPSNRYGISTLLFVIANPRNEGVAIQRVLLCYVVPGFTLRFECKCNLLGYTSCRVIFARQVTE